MKAERLDKLWGPAVMCALAILATAPLLFSPLPLTHDGIHHLYRLVGFDYCLREGLSPFPRWAPTFAHGFGYPIFNYYNAISYWPAEALHLLGLDFSRALAASFALIILLAGLGMYLLGRDLWGEAGGVISAAAYVFAPYSFVHNTFVRGPLGECLALALFPLVVWAFRRLVITGRRRWVVVAGGTLAVFLLTHMISDLLFTPLLVAYVAGLWVLRWRRGQSHAAWWVVVGTLILAGGLSLFHLLPAYFEKSYVGLPQMLSVEAADFHRHFLPLGDLFALPATQRSLLLHPPFYRALGWAQLALAALSALALWRKQRAILCILLIGLAAGCFLILPQSVWLWEHLPLIAYLPYPWRFLGPVGVGLAVLAGASARLLGGNRQRTTTLVTVALVGTVLLAIPALYPRPDLRPVRGLTIGDQIAFEHNTGMVGTTSYAEYLPVTAEVLPTDPSLEAAIREGRPAERFDAAILPAGARIVATEYGFNRAEVVVNSPQAFRARYLCLYFPGWRVTVDGRPVPIVVTAPHGLISFDVPAGEHTIRVWFGDTPLRVASVVISLASVVGLVGLAWAAGRRQSSLSVKRGELEGSAALLLVALALVVAKFAFVDHVDNVLRRDGFDGQRVEDARADAHFNFDERVTLVGYDVPSAGTSGQALDIALYWARRAELEAALSVVLTLHDARGLEYGRSSTVLPGDPDPEQWASGYYACDSHALTIAPATPPGEYELRVFVYDPLSGGGLPARDSGGAALEVPVALATVCVEQPRTPPDPITLDVPHRTNVAFDSLKLLGYGLTPERAAPGERLYLDLLWQAEEPSAMADRVRVTGVREGEVVWAAEIPPVEGYPTLQWIAGEVVWGRHVLFLPGDLAPGTLHLWLSAPDGAGEDVPLGDIEVTQP